jgi:hypothetical protein
MSNMPRQDLRLVRDLRKVTCNTLVALALVLNAPVLFAAHVAQQSFASPEQGIAALVEAAKSNDREAWHAILGVHSGKLVDSGDAVADERRRAAFVKAYGEANRVVLEGDNKATLMIGKDEWPMPIPLVKAANGWRFDTVQGEQEILKRRIGKNELAAIQVCLAVVDAEREYVTQDRDSNSVLEYAPKFVSSPGKRDGLYWETKADEPPSPLGALIAGAARDGYAGAASTPLAPYYGYYYRILTRQGKDAKGGEYDYVVRGKMIGGFAVIAYPARYRASGVMSFMVNQDGVVYEKDLGRDSAAIASKMITFNPGAGWKVQRTQPNPSPGGAASN